MQMGDLSQADAPFSSGFADKATVKDYVGMVKAAQQAAK